MRLLKYLSLGAVVLLLVGIATVYGVLHASLPQLDGTAHQPPLSATVRIERDARGVPTLSAATRADLAYATGFVHAQDRFFEMDLSRRLAAGELAELFGTVALDEDRSTRLFGFRRVALQVLAAATPAQRRVLEAYTHGVNAGLHALGARPWEYWLLGQQPQPWRAEDALLVEYAMWWDLQANGFKREILRREINARLKGPDCAGGWKCALSFFYPQGTSWDAPALHRRQRAGCSAARCVAARRARRRARTCGRHEQARRGRCRQQQLGGGGRLTAAAAQHWWPTTCTWGSAYPPSGTTRGCAVRLPGGQSALDLNGVTLPGTPLLVAGSNGHIAWGFTNSYGNWLDVTPLPCTVRGEDVRLADARRLRAADARARADPREGRGQCVADGGFRPDGVLLRADAQQQPAGSARGWRSCRRPPTSTSWSWKRATLRGGGTRTGRADRHPAPERGGGRSRPATLAGRSSAAFRRTPVRRARCARCPGPRPPSSRGSSIRPPGGSGPPMRASPAMRVSSN